MLTHENHPSITVHQVWLTVPTSDPVASPVLVSGKEPHVRGHVM